MNCTCKFSRSCCKLQTCRDTNFLSIKNQTGRASVGRTRLCGPCPTRLQASSASVGRTRLWTMILDPCLCGPGPTRLQPQPACLGPGIIYGPVWAQSVAYGNSNQWATNQAGLYGCGTLRQVKAHLISRKRIAKLLHRTCSLP